MHESYVARTVAEGNYGFGVLLYPYSQPTLLPRIIVCAGVSGKVIDVSGAHGEVRIS